VILAHVGKTEAKKREYLAHFRRGGRKPLRKGHFGGQKTAGILKFP